MGSVTVGELGERGGDGAVTCRQAGAAGEGTGERAGPRGRRDGERRASTKMPTDFPGMQNGKARLEL